MNFAISVRFRRAPSRVHQLGLTLLEMLLALSILGGILAGLAGLLQSASEDAKASVAARHISVIGDAANAYIKDNYSVLTSVATNTTPALLDVATLIAGGYLTEGYSPTNAWGQATCVLVLQPSPNKLSGLVVTEGGTSIDDLSLGQIAATIGGAGGGIYSTAPATLRGAMGGYSFPVGAYANPNHLGRRCNGVPGNISLVAGHPVMALWYADAMNAVSTLYRDSVPGNPGLNTMNTPILMSASSARTIDTACAPNGALARDANGAVLSCELGEWKKGGSAFWQDPVSTFVNLPTCNASSLGHTRVVHTPAVGTERRAYTCDGGGTWVALGVDNNGNLTAPGTVTASRGRFSRDGIGPVADATLSLSEYTAVTGRRAGISLHNGGIHEGNIELAASGSRRTVFSDNSGIGLGIEATGNIQTKRYFQVDSISIEGSACPTPGLIGRDAAGGVLSCKSGFWASPKAALACGTVARQQVNASSVQCPAGTTMTGGGCDGGVTDHYNTSAPSGNGWFCQNWKYQGKVITSYAVCCGS